jgi:hypothetical protein
MVMVGGSIITFKAGEFETTDDETCKALEGATGVEQVKQVKKKKKSD